jgi:hypothetical protein
MHRLLISVNTVDLKIMCSLLVLIGAIDPKIRQKLNTFECNFIFFPILLKDLASWFLTFSVFTVLLLSILIISEIVA